MSSFHSQLSMSLGPLQEMNLLIPPTWIEGEDDPLSIVVDED
jgi:hypothetical protein